MQYLLKEDSSNSFNQNKNNNLDEGDINIITNISTQQQQQQQSNNDIVDSKSDPSIDDPQSQLIELNHTGKKKKIKTIYIIFFGSTV